jgi:hypothetical protein
VMLLAGVQVVFDIFSKSLRCLPLLQGSRGSSQQRLGNPFDISITGYSSSPPERVKIVVAQAYYAIICHAFLSTSSTIPLSTYSTSLRVSVSMLAVIRPRKLI